MKLDQLTVGTKATVSAISGDPAVVQRLYELGLMEGEVIELLAVAPFGDPIEIRCGSARLSLRKSEAAGISLADPI